MKKMEDEDQRQYSKGSSRGQPCYDGVRMYVVDHENIEENCNIIRNPWEQGSRMMG